MTRRSIIYPAFIISGVAGLMYEALWGRYLGLYVGHSAYAQVLVLGVYLGGMSIGALSVGERSKSLSSPLMWYARVEAALAVFGILFHPIFVGMLDLSYDVVFPALGSAGGVGAVRWGLAGLVIMPQAILLGTTFPLMAAGLVCADQSRPGRGVATVYLLNTLGGAAGVLIAGFWLIDRVGLPGTSVAAALLNLSAAALVWFAVRGQTPASADASAGLGTSEDEVERLAHAPESGTNHGGESGDASAPSWASPRLASVLLTVSFLTAMASFAYEIGWIRMLSLVLGSATHSFELMVSAFVLGLAAGAW